MGIKLWHCKKESCIFWDLSAVVFWIGVMSLFGYFTFLGLSAVHFWIGELYLSGLECSICFFLFECCISLNWMVVLFWIGVFYFIILQSSMF